MTFNLTHNIHRHLCFAVVLLGIGIGVFGVSPQSLAAPASPKGGQSGLVFTAALDKTEYIAEEPINLTFVLKNQGSSSSSKKNPVYVNTRFYFGSEEAPKNQKEVYVTITSPSGEKLPYKFPYETGYPKTDYFTLLEPNQEAKADYPRNLRGNFEFKEEGAYTVTAVYQNTFGRELGLDAFQGRLTTQPVKFVIKNAGRQGFNN